MVVLDGFSRIAVVYLMERKDETGHYLKTFAKSARNLLGRNGKICYLRSDKGAAFTGRYTKEWLEKDGIEQRATPPNNPLLQMSNFL